MGLLDKFMKRGDDAPVGAPVVEGFSTDEISQHDCSACEVHYPKSFKQDKSPIWKSCPPTAAQILVASGNQDWSRDPADDEGPYAKVCRALGEAVPAFEKIAGGNIRVNATNQECELGNNIRVTVIPQFIYIDTTAEKCVEDVSKILSLKSTDQYTPDLGNKVTDKGLILLCSHKTRDKKCGISAPIMLEALSLELRETDLYRDFDDDTPGGVRVLFVNHVGGHKWAANCFYYSNDGSAVLMAMVRPEYAKAIVQETVVKGVVFTDLLRNCSKNPAFEW